VNGELPGDVEQRFREALALRSAPEVWAHLSPLRARLTEREVALAWMTLAQASPRERSLGDDALAVLGALGGDADVVTATLTALVRRIDAGGIDAPIDVEDALDAGIAHARTLTERATAPSAPLLAALGNAILRRRPEDEAGLSALTAAITADPEGPWLVDLLRAHKRARRFRAALPLARNAVKRHGAKPALLAELAIVALGAGEPDEAAEALTGLGLTVERAPGALPLVPDLTPLAVRVPSRPPRHAMLSMADGATGAFETIWVQPLSPMHGVVRTATFREAPCDFGDVILFDVAPIAMVPVPSAPERMAPLLAYLMVLRPGDERRLPFLALEQQQGQTERIFAALPEGAVVQVHSQSVQKVCPRCMAGETLVKHEHLPPEDQPYAVGKIVIPAALDLSAVAAAIEAAKAREPGVLLAIPALYEALKRTAEAGKHHQRWGAIERGLGAAR
jgi:hypothetical protein